jgi:trehalose/maltose hydrolase-like predicted phosphorylase
MFLLGHEFSPEQKKRNFDYYDRLTTGDSSLSSCIQSIVAFEVGDDEIALRYLINALLMDLADVGGNVKDGCHIASMGGTWMGAVYGLAGLRDHGGRLSFRPHKLVRDLRFRLAVRGQRLAVHVGSGGTTAPRTSWRRGRGSRSTTGTSGWICGRGNRSVGPEAPAPGRSRARDLLLLRSRVPASRSQRLPHEAARIVRPAR